MWVDVCAGSPFSGTCQDLRCEYYAKCVENGGQPTCQCPTLGECSGRDKPVCGSDGVVYKSECHMKVASCQAKASITVRNKGVCGMFKSLLERV